MDLPPFFVYGTLLPEQPNFDLWGEALLHIEPATLPGGRLYDVGGFPLLVEGGDEAVQGCLVHVKAGAYADILARLDHLEQYDPEREDNVYRRVRREVVTGDGRSHLAWLYVGDPQYATGLPAVPDNDWAAYSDARAADIAAWWADHTRGQDPFFPDITG